MYQKFKPNWQDCNEDEGLLSTQVWLLCTSFGLHKEKHARGQEMDGFYFLAETWITIAWRYSSSSRSYYTREIGKTKYLIYTYEPQTNE